MTAPKRLPRWLILAGAAGFSLSIYLLVSQLTLRLGFPLDDAWIHQTYARNLVNLGEWSFIPGSVSAGSTSPLWSLIIAVGYFLRVNNLAWTYLAGWASLAGLAWIGDRWSRSLSEGNSYRLPWVGLFLAVEWHLVWASGSGMETALYSLLIMIVFWQLSQENIPPFVIGMVCGLIVWVRPDGLTLIGPVLMVFVLSKREWQRILRDTGLFGLGVLACVAPYLLFNFATGGQWWPNTFYAKQAEYAVYLQETLLLRMGKMLIQPLIGAGIIFAPGLCYLMWDSWRKRRWLPIAAGIWWLGFSLIYAFFLPVTYQHARYLIPAMPVFFTLAGAGTLKLINLLAASVRLRLLRFAWLSTLFLVLLAFWVQGALAYGQDVAIIESEMVTVGKWIEGNTPAGALIAAHDIGAIGFYGNRPILDLAGLVSPEVIPFIRDEDRLADYLDRQGADYLVTFPDWYPKLTGLAVPVYQTQERFSVNAGGENMTIYRWRGSATNVKR